MPVIFHPIVPSLPVFRMSFGNMAPYLSKSIPAFPASKAVSHLFGIQAWRDEVPPPLPLQHSISFMILIYFVSSFSIVPSSPPNWPFQSSGHHTDHQHESQHQRVELKGVCFDMDGTLTEACIDFGLRRLKRFDRFFTVYFGFRNFRIRILWVTHALFCVTGIRFLKIVFNVTNKAEMRRRAGVPEGDILKTIAEWPEDKRGGWVIIFVRCYSAGSSARVYFPPSYLGVLLFSCFHRVKKQSVMFYIDLWVCFKYKFLTLSQPRPCRRSKRWKERL